MHADLGQFLAVGVPAVLFAGTALVLLVRGDLAPHPRLAGAMGGGGQVFLGAALGLGIVAFTIKLAVIVTLTGIPSLLPEPGLRRAPAPDIPIVADAAPEPSRSPWQDLPALVPEPAGNPSNPAKVALGERLFHDPILSRDGTVACASCHDVRTGAGADGRPTAIGITGVPGGRNTPTVFNAAFQARLFWDGRAASLEDQAGGPVVNPAEMGMPSLAEAAERLKRDASYGEAFARAFGPGAEITGDTLTAAIAAYERTLVTRDSPYDRFVAGDSQAMSPEQQRGMWLFQSVGCVRCHSGPNFSGAALVGPRNPYMQLMAAGSPYDARYGLSRDKGRAPPESKDGVWRIPSLRNVALTAPYFHNGSVADLSEAVRIMAQLQAKAVVTGRGGQAGGLWWSAENRTFSTVEPRRLDDRDVADLVAFLHALSSDSLAARAGVAHP